MPEAHQPWPKRGDCPNRLAITSWIKCEASKRLDQADFLRDRMLIGENIAENKRTISIAP